MVNVIKYGKKRRICCCECESILEFEKDDVKEQKVGINEYERYINCPVCNNDLVIPYKMGE